MEKWRVHCILRQLYLTWLVCCNSRASHSSVAPSFSSGLQFLSLLCTHIEISLAEPRVFLRLERWGRLHKKLWMWVRLLRREEAFAQSFALGCLDVIIPEWSTGNHTFNLCYSKFDVSELVLCVLSKHWMGTSWNSEKYCILNTVTSVCLKVD